MSYIIVSKHKDLVTGKSVYVPEIIGNKNDFKAKKVYAQTLKKTKKINSSSKALET